jgi:hypothetical protein
MTNEEAQKVLDEWQGVRPECLEGEAKKLFEAIMKIADERDNLKEEVDQKEKIIDLMANHIATNDSNLCQYLDMTTKCKYYAGENGKICDECIKQYFENKAKEILNK